MNPRTTEQIEDLGLRPDDTWYALLVMAGVRTGAWLHVQSNIWRDGDEPQFIPDDRIKQIHRVFTDASINVAIRRRVTDAGLFQPNQGTGRRRFVELADILIANNEETLSKLKEGVERMNHRQIGEALGYPTTAIEVFDKQDEKIFIDDLPPEVAYSEVGQLTFFALSKDHWQDELRVVAEWVEALKKLSPLTFSECRSRYILPDEISKILIKNR